MTKEKAIKIAADYFPNYPDQDTLHVTSDEQVFFEEAMANSHAATIKEGKSVKVSRDEVPKPAAKEKKSDADTKKSEGAGKGKKNVAEKTEGEGEEPGTNEKQPGSEE